MYGKSMLHPPPLMFIFLSHQTQKLNWMFIFHLLLPIIIFIQFFVRPSIRGAMKLTFHLALQSSLKLLHIGNIVDISWNAPPQNQIKLNNNGFLYGGRNNTSTIALIMADMSLTFISMIGIGSSTPLFIELHDIVKGVDLAWPERIRTPSQIASSTQIQCDTITFLRDQETKFSLS